MSNLTKFVSRKLLALFLAAGLVVHHIAVVGGDSAVILAFLGLVGAYIGGQSYVDGKNGKAS